MALVILLIVLLVAVISAGALAKARLRSKYPPLGRMVDVGGYTLHLYTQGEQHRGGPTVVLDAGAGGTILHWSLVQPQVAEFCKVVAYDRAGLGWSEAGTRPRTFEQMVDELDRLLHAGDISGPYILVGHSFGGIVIRQYARRFPDRVAGMVLVDSAHEEQFTTRFPQQVRDMALRMNKVMRLMNLIYLTGIPAIRRAVAPYPQLPPHILEMDRAVRVSSARHPTATLDEFEAVTRRPPEKLETLGMIPLIVLSHGVAQNVPGLSRQANEDYEAAWQAQQIELAGLSTQGHRVVAEGHGHDIPIEAPELVVEAIRQVWDAVRKIEAVKRIQVS